MTAVKTNLENKLDIEIERFLSQCEIKDFATKFSKKITYDDFLKDRMLIIFAIRSGIPYSLFDLIQNYTPFTETEWAEFLSLSTKSLQRYKISSHHHFKPGHSEKIIEVAEVTKIGQDIFGSMEKFRLWLITPNYALGNFEPIDLLKDSYGKELVINELTRINYGILV